MRVPRYDYAAQFADTLATVASSIQALLTRGDYMINSDVKTFESRFAALVGTAYGRGVGCGTDALMMTLRALNIGRGDEVITQANTFYATAAAIALAGATPVLVDADEETFLLDQSKLERAITPNTRAIIVVHLYGKPTPMEPIVAIARAHDLIVIEDAAQAHGAAIDGKFVGSFGTAGCFSFHPSKNLAAAGDAGIVVTDSAELADLIDAHRTHGQLVQHEHIVLGANSKLDAVQAIVLNAKLDKLMDWNASRRETAAFYRNALSGLPLRFQREDANELHAYHLFQVRTSRRDELMRHLQDAGVDAVVRYPHPIHLQPPFACYGWSKGDFPVAEMLADELLCLPIRPGMPQAERDYVVEQVQKFYAQVPA